MDQLIEDTTRLLNSENFKDFEGNIFLIKQVDPENLREAMKLMLAKDYK